MIPKDTVIDLARSAGLSGPEIVEMRTLGTPVVLYQLHCGTAGNKAFIEIDPEDDAASVKEKIGVLKGVPQTRGNKLVGEKPPSVVAPTAAPPPVKGLKDRG
jgi:hypothetical protein